MRLAHIVAAAENNVIGKNGGLPWDIPEDMKFFREKTKGRIVIMGRKTFESVGHALPHRLNIVITRTPSYTAKGAIVVPSLEKALEYCKAHEQKYGEEVYIIGGGEIYRQSLKLVDIVYLTRIHKKFEGDATYPELDPKNFEEVERRDRYQPIAFSFLTYLRKKPKSPATV